MNNALARELLLSELAAWRTKSYLELTKSIGGIHLIPVIGTDGKRYQIEVQAFWDARPQKNVRVTGTIDDGGWLAFFPLTQSFIVAPDGSFVGEK